MVKSRTNKQTLTLILNSDFQYDKRKIGWTLVEDVPLEGGKTIFGIAKLLKNSEDFVDGDTMQSRAKKLREGMTG